jgi:glutaredoxin 3
MTDNNSIPQLSVKAQLASSKQPVTLYTLSWCSYCHAAKQLLKQLNIPFHLIELDSGEYREPVLNQRLRQELQQLTGSNTLPQVFIGEQSVGGYTDTQAALKSGLLKKMLEPYQIILPGGSSR